MIPSYSALNCNTAWARLILYIEVSLLPSLNMPPAIKIVPIPVSWGQPWFERAGWKIVRRPGFEAAMTLQLKPNSNFLRSFQQSNAYSNFPKNWRLRELSLWGRGSRDFRWGKEVTRWFQVMMRRTLFDGYLFKYCSVKYQTFYQVSEKTSQQTHSHQKLPEKLSRCLQEP